MSGLTTPGVGVSIIPLRSFSKGEGAIITIRRGRTGSAGSDTVEQAVHFTAAGSGQTEPAVDSPQFEFPANQEIRASVELSAITLFLRSSVWHHGGMKKFILIVPILFGFSATSFAGTLEDGMKAYKARQYATAAPLLKDAANKGDAAAQYWLATLYARGNGVPKDGVEAFELYRKSAEAGFARSQFMMGLFHTRGRYVPRDYAAAAGWLEKAAASNNSDAQYLLGRLHLFGRGVNRDPATAASYVRKAAEQNHVEALDLLGRLYKQGVGIEQDFDQAVIWLDKAAKLGSVPALNLLGYMYTYRQGVDRDYTKANGYFMRSAFKGNAIAQYNLGLNFLKGQGVPVSHPTALLWLRKSANQKYAKAQAALSDVYSNGRRGVERDFVKAYIWADLALRSGEDLEKLKRVAGRNRSFAADELSAGQLARAKQAAENCRRQPETCP